MNHEALRKEILSSVRRVVIKLGSSVVTKEDGLDYQIIQGLVDDICNYKEKGQGVHPRLVRSHRSGHQKACTQGRSQDHPPETGCGSGGTEPIDDHL